jgi:hypothetical protein
MLIERIEVDLLDEDWVCTPEHGFRFSAELDLLSFRLAELVAGEFWIVEFLPG